MQYFATTHPTLEFDIIVSFDSDRKITNVVCAIDQEDIAIDAVIRERLGKEVDCYLEDS